MSHRRVTSHHRHSHQDDSTSDQADVKAWKTAELNHHSSESASDSHPHGKKHHKKHRHHHHHHDKQHNHKSSAHHAHPRRVSPASPSSGNNRSAAPAASAPQNKNAGFSTINDIIKQLEKLAASLSPNHNKSAASGSQNNHAAPPSLNDLLNDFEGQAASSESATSASFNTLMDTLDQPVTLSTPDFSLKSNSTSSFTPSQVSSDPAVSAPSAAPSGSIPANAYVANSSRDYQTIQEPSVKGRGGQEIRNITDLGNGITQYRLRYENGWRDGDRNLSDTTRQRAETRNLGPKVFQQQGETWEYGTTFRTNPNFHASGHFCHVEQIKGYSSKNGTGDLGTPLVTLSITDAKNGMLTCTVSRSGSGGPKTPVAVFKVKAGDWCNVRFRVKTGPDGALSASINGGAWQGKSGINMSVPRQQSTDLKVGLYRSTAGLKPGWDDYVQHKNPYRAKLSGA